MNALSEYAWERFEPDYGDPTCPGCGSMVKDSEDVTEEEALAAWRKDQEEGIGGMPPEPDKDYYCLGCFKSWWSDAVTPDEPNGQILDDDEYVAVVDSSNDVMLFRSPYYTHAQYASPCVPGAGHLGHPCPTGPKTYCFDKSWFTGDKAPYPVYKVDTGELVP